MDAEDLALKNLPFEIHEITTQEHRQFAFEFAVRHRWTIAQGDGSVRLSPRGSAPEQPN